MKRYAIISIFFVCLFSMVVTGSNAQPIPRFVDNDDGTVTDTANGLMWLKTTPSPILKHAVTWFEAKKECEELAFAGYNDWRLPTIKEWKTIIDNKYQSPALIEPNPFQNVIVQLAYWSASEYAIGADNECGPGECALHSYVVQLYYGQVKIQSKVTRAFVWPVRSIKKLVKTTVIEHKNR